MSRIQLRLPAGSTKIVEVDSSASLHDLKQKVSEVCLPYSTIFSLVCCLSHLIEVTEFATQCFCCV